MKISKIKRNNLKRGKFSKKSKVKNAGSHGAKKHLKKVKLQHDVSTSQNLHEHSEEEEDDYLDMLDQEEIEYMEETMSKKSNFQHILNNTRSQIIKKTSKTKDSELEQKYEKNILQPVHKNTTNKEVRFLLPVKSQDGHIEKRIVKEAKENETNKGKMIHTEKKEEIEDEEDEFLQAMEIETDEPVSVAKLLASRQETLNSRRFTIGNLCSRILENPELNVKNLSILLEFMSDNSPETCITVRKLVTASLSEVFKDILPTYQIHQTKQDDIKLKKDTLQLQNYEATLLRNYKQYLQKLEKLAGALRKKYPQIKDNTIKNKQEMDAQLAALAVNCMCELLVAHPHFNFANNIAHFLVPLLDSKHENIRQNIAVNIGKIFKEDKRGELSLLIVRRLNQYIKQKKHCVHAEVLEVLLSLRIKDVNLDKEKEEETKQKKLMSHKQRILALSKRERKRDKKLREVEQEMLETKAEENKQNRMKLFTEMTSIVFTIYFRILKQAPSSKVLSVCLEGLAKFAHCINLEFYQDLVNVLNSLLEQEDLGLRERLNCIFTVFTILSGQASILNIDPRRFYSHLYKNVPKIFTGTSNDEMIILLNILVQALIGRQKSIAQSKLVAFVKRIAMMALYLQHHGTLGILGIIKTILQLGKGAHILLDTDSNIGDGIYSAELDEPEYCNAHCTALWETVALQRHYHSIVQNIAKNIAWQIPTNGEGSLSPELSKLKPMELFTEFDPTNVAFKPAIPTPKKVVPKLSSSNHYFANSEFGEFVNSFNQELQ